MAPLVRPSPAPPNFVNDPAHSTQPRTGSRRGQDMQKRIDYWASAAPQAQWL
jgi:hypothetical protein